jgi:hypothetical protein
MNGEKYSEKKLRENEIISWEITNWAVLLILF